MSAEAIERVGRAVRPAYVPLALCVCGHETDAHEHRRPGDDCVVCGPVRCRRYRRRTGRGARVHSSAR